MVDLQHTRLEEAVLVPIEEEVVEDFVDTVEVVVVLDCIGGVLDLGIHLLGRDRSSTTWRTCSTRSCLCCEGYKGGLTAIHRLYEL